MAETFAYKIENLIKRRKLRSRIFGIKNRFFESLNSYSLQH